MGVVGRCSRWMVSRRAIVGGHTSETVGRPVQVCFPAGLPGGLPTAGVYAAGWVRARDIANVGVLVPLSRPRWGALVAWISTGSTVVRNLIPPLMLLMLY